MCYITCSAGHGHQHYIRSVSGVLMSLRLKYQLIILYCTTEQQQQQKAHEGRFLTHTIGQPHLQRGQSSGRG